MDPEVKKHFDDVHALMNKVHPHFHRVNSFVAMMTLADLIAQWVLSHETDKQPHMVANLIACTQDRMQQLMDDMDEETRH
jgi:hypothetical protein